MNTYVCNTYLQSTRADIVFVRSWCFFGIEEPSSVRKLDACWVLGSLLTLGARALSALSSRISGLARSPCSISLPALFSCKTVRYSRFSLRSNKRAGLAWLFHQAPSCSAEAAARPSSPIAPHAATLDASTVLPRSSRRTATTVTSSGRSRRARAAEARRRASARGPRAASRSTSPAISSRARLPSRPSVCLCCVHMRWRTRHRRATPYMGARRGGKDANGRTGGAQRRVWGGCGVGFGDRCARGSKEGSKERGGREGRTGGARSPAAQAGSMRGLRRVDLIARPCARPPAGTCAGQRRRLCPRPDCGQPQVKRARPPRPAGGASEGGALLGRATATQLDPSCYGAPACPKQRYMSTGPPPWESSPGWKWPPPHSHMDRLACQHGGAAGKSAHIGGDPKPTAQTAATRCRRARRLRAGGVRGQHTRGRPSMRHRANLRHGPPPGARSPRSLSTPPRRAPGERGCFA